MRIHLVDGPMDGRIFDIPRAGPEEIFSAAWIPYDDKSNQRRVAHYKICENINGRLAARYVGDLPGGPQEPKFKFIPLMRFSAPGHPDEFPNKMSFDELAEYGELSGYGQPCGLYEMMKKAGVKSDV